MIWKIWDGIWWHKQLCDMVWPRSEIVLYCLVVPFWSCMLYSVCRGQDHWYHQNHMNWIWLCALAIQITGKLLGSTVLLQLLVHYSYNILSHNLPNKKEWLVSCNAALEDLNYHYIIIDLLEEEARYWKRHTHTKKRAYMMEIEHLHPKFNLKFSSATIWAWKHPNSVDVIF